MSKFWRPIVPEVVKGVLDVEVVKGVVNVGEEVEDGEVVRMVGDVLEGVKEGYRVVLEEEKGSKSGVLEVDVTAAMSSSVRCSVGFSNLVLESMMTVISGFSATVGLSHRKYSPLSGSVSAGGCLVL